MAGEPVDPVAGRRAADVAVPVLLVALAAALLALVAPMLTRPLWYNEQWRAFHLSLPGMPFRADPDTNSPISFGYAALVRLSTSVFGQTPLALRLPGIVALPVLGVLTYRLARRWVGPTAAGLVAAALLANRLVLTFAAELAPYTVEAASTVGVLLLWLGAQDAGVSGAARWARYVGLALLALVATPVAFVLGPLLLVDLVRGVRARSWQRLLGSLLVGLVTLAHVVLYVGRQSLQAHSTYWEETFVSRGPGALADVWQGLASYVPSALTGGTSHLPSVLDGEVGFPGPLRFVLMGLMVAGLVAGVVLAQRDPRLRPLSMVLLGVLGLQVVASMLHRWPFGFTRVNTFLLPLGYLAVAVASSRVGAAVRDRWSPLAAPLAGAAAYALVVAVAVQQVAVVRREAPRTAYAVDLAEIVRTVRARAGPDDVAVLVHGMARKGWLYEMRHPRGASGVSIPPERTLTVDASKPDVAAVGDFLDAHPGAGRIYVAALRGTPPSTLRVVLSAAAARSYTQSGVWRLTDVGVRELTRR